LQTLASAWSKKWEGAHEHSQRLLRLCASGYFDKGYARWHLVNLMKRGVTSIASFLIEGDPKVGVYSKVPSMKQYAYGRQLILNHLIKENNFADEVFIPGATASLFGAAIARTFFEYNRAVSVDGEMIKIGNPRVTIIDPVDYIGDPSCKKRCDFAIEGDTYRLPTEYAKELFSHRNDKGQQVSDFITPDCKLITKYSSEEMAAKGSFDFNKLALDSYTTFQDIYLRKERKFVTIMPMGKKAITINEVEWKGPGSPYDYLGYFYAPDIPIPIPPAWDWYDLDVTTNIMAKTAREQAESQKNVIITDPSSKKTGEQIVSAKNMDVITATSPESVKALALGGVNPDNYNWLEWASREFTKAGTTPDVLRGAGAQANTLGQEQMIFSNATRIIQNFDTRFTNWMSSILNKWSWAVGQSPSTYIEILDTVSVPGYGDYEYPVIFSKGDKVAEFESFTMDVVPHSTRKTSPEDLYQRLYQFLTTWMLPTMEGRAAQGTTIDFAVVDRLLADYGGFENFPSWYKSIVPQEQVEVTGVMQSGQGQSKSPGQSDDRFGASQGSKMANLGQQQNRAGVGGETAASPGAK